MTRLTYCVVAMLLVLQATVATATAQGRGRGSSGGPSRMVRTGAASAPARAASRPAMRPPARMASPTSNRHVTARPRRYVFIDPVYPGLSNGFYNPYGYSPFYSGPYLPSYADPYYSAPPRSESNGDLAYQVQLLVREVERLREDHAHPPPPVSKPPAPQPAPPPPPPVPEPPPPPIALVFRDGRRLNIQSYAFVRQTLWLLGNQSSAKIAVSELDLDATQRANPGRGLLFNQPQVKLLRSGF